MLCYVHAGLLAAGQAQQLSPDTDRFNRIMVQGRELRKAGQYSNAVNSFRSAAEIAHFTGNSDQQAQAMLAESGCEIRLFRYAAALNTVDKAYPLALRTGNNTVLGGLANNRSLIYSQLGNFQAAEQATNEAIEFLRKSSQKDYFARALINKGEIQFGLNYLADGKRPQVVPEGVAAFAQAIQISQKNNLPEDEATASDSLGIWLVIVRDLPRAESALRRAYEIRKKQGDKDSLAISEEHLAELELQKGQPFLSSALQHINSALTSGSKELKTDPQYYPLHIRGQILLGLGQKDKALAELRRAVNAADTWRQSALPGDATNIRTVAVLHDVYHDYAELAAELAIQRNNQALAADAFEVLARNRAASLREQLTHSYSRKFLLSPEYYELLQRLQAAQADVTLASNPAKSRENQRKLAQIRAELSDFENRIGLRQNFLQGSEINRYQNSLKGVQSKLAGSEALLSFSLGSRKSFLWTITNSELRAYELPNQEIIEKEANDFSRAISEKWANRDSLGQAFSRSLFSKVAPAIAHKPNWLLTVDGKLLDKVPFSALPMRSENGTVKPLSAVHALRFLPSALLVCAPKAPRAIDRFIGVGDPIYNRADARREHPPAKATPKQTDSLTTLARLVGSEREIRAAAKASGLPQAEMLTGPNASGTELRQVLATPPQILHFAVHVVSPKDRPGEAALALSLTPKNVPELLTAESVATYRTPGSLVVLSGCASQQGEVVPGAGLVGLSRAWLLAGASAVIVSAWPTPDDSGQFFSRFYSHLQKTSGPIAQRAAVALQQTQSDMQASSGYRSDASFWAAYSIISKE
ncbi:MAG: CHAT domain-containing protein [Bryobacteraceae bacterium]